MKPTHTVTMIAKASRTFVKSKIARKMPVRVTAKRIAAFLDSGKQYPVFDRQTGECLSSSRYFTCSLDLSTLAPIGEAK